MYAVQPNSDATSLPKIPLPQEINQTSRYHDCIFECSCHAVPVFSSSFGKNHVFLPHDSSSVDSLQGGGGISRVRTQPKLFWSGPGNLSGEDWCCGKCGDWFNQPEKAISPLVICIICEKNSSIFLPQHPWDNINVTHRNFPRWPEFGYLPWMSTFGVGF